MSWIHALRRYLCAMGIVILSVFAQCANAQSNQDAIDSLVRQLKQPIRSGRIEAATKLAAYGPQAASATEALISCLSDSESDIRVVAAYALGCIQDDPLKVLTALAPLLSDGDEHVRYSAEWSIARIGRTIDDPGSTETCKKLIAVFDQALKQLSQHATQPRHKVAIELSMARLKALLATTTPPEPPKLIEAPKPTSPTENIDLASRVYEASDRLARLQIVEKLRNDPQSAGTQELQRLIIQIERRSSDPTVLDYAAARWGADSQDLIDNWLEILSKMPKLDEIDANIVKLFDPKTTREFEVLLKWAADESLPFEVRVAAIESIANTKRLRANVLGQMLQWAVSPKFDATLRSILLDSVAELGHVAADIAETPLIDMLSTESDEELLVAAASTLSRIAPQSPRAAKACCDAFLKQDPASSQFYLWLESVSRFQSLAGPVANRIAEQLKNTEPSTRELAAEALGKIGPQAHSSAGALIERICDEQESVGVKSSAAVALGRFGESSIAQLIDSLQSTSEITRRDVLQSISLIGPEASVALSACLNILQDSSASPELRAAAANAIGSMNGRASSAFGEIAKYCGADQPDVLAANCLIAIAKILPSQAKTIALSRCEDPSPIVRASAAMAAHLCGESRLAFDVLIKMLNGSDADAVIEGVLSDLGPVAERWMVETAGDLRAGDMQRLTCFRLAACAKKPDWTKLLPLLSDYAIGEDMASYIAGDWTSDTEALANLLSVLRSESIDPLAYSRIATLLTPDGLGAGEAEPDWQGLTLSKPSAWNVLADSPSQAMEAEANPDPVMPDEPIASAAPPLPSRTIQPAIPIRAQGQEIPPKAGEPKIVRVFYGTNRSRISNDHGQNELAVSVLATAGGGLLAMVFCLFGFLRNGNRRFALVALIAIAVLAPLGLHAASKLTRSSQRIAVSYGAEYRPEIELGTCEVSIPPNHQPGMLEAPTLYTLQVKPDVQKHVVLTAVENLTHERFYEAMHATMDQKGKNMLVFIHGYNVSFEDAARRTAQMSIDLEFPGVAAFYSWPSQANWYGYALDKDNIELSVTQIKSFLLDLASNSNAETINLIAHSMGNVGLTQALKAMDDSHKGPLFNQVVLAAPDIDAEVFKDRIAPNIVAKAQHVTLYTSQTDLALIASRFFNNGPRAGDSGAGVLRFPASTPSMQLL